MYCKSLFVFAPCTAFVVAFATILNYDAAGLGDSQIVLHRPAVVLPYEHERDFPRKGLPSTSKGSMAAARTPGRPPKSPPAEGGAPCGPSVQTHPSTPINTQQAPISRMLVQLATRLQELGSWLQAAAAAVPISQLSVVTWAIFAVGGACGANGAFNTSERLAGPISKTSFQ